VVGRMKLRDRAGIPTPTVGGREAATTAAGFDVVVGRQGIYRSDRTIDGYELLFRSDASSTTSVSALTSDQMTTDVLLNALSIGLENLVGDQRIYLNVDQELLTEPWDLWLPADRTVIEVLETVRVDDELLEGCDRLIERGFVVALDDFTWFDGAESLLERASIVKIDLLAVHGEDRRRLVRICQAYDVTLLAEKIEDLGELGQLQDEGFMLFQGFALERPQIVAGRSVEPSALARLRTAAVVLDNDLEIDDLERIIRTEPGMAYQIIRLASIGRSGETLRTVATLRDAIVILGTRHCQQFLAILLTRPSGPDWKPALVGVLARARACEVLTGQLYPAAQSVGFAAGLISALDAVLGVPLPEIAASMNLSEALSTALLDPTSDIGRILVDLIAHQLGDRGHRLISAASADDLDLAFGEGFIWATRALSAG
jgi:EAL and modified HD-GYP domain-containing signal transduction protein